MTAPTAEPEAAVRLLDEDEQSRHAEITALFERRAASRQRKLAVHFALLRSARWVR